MSTYDYYRIFYHVAQQHSFTKAAEVLHNNQPNITRCMNNLETELGCHLFVRSNRGVSLTPEGQKLFNHVAIAFEQLELGETELKRDQSLTSGLISIGVSENALRIMLLPKLEAFHNHYPHVRLKISNHSTPQAIASLESGLVDFAVVTTPLSVQKQFQKISLGSFREILIAGPKYKELASHICSLEELAEYPFVSLENNTSTRDLHIQYFSSHGFPFRPDLEVTSTDQCLALIQRGNSSDSSERISSCKTHLSCTKCFQATKYCSTETNRDIDPHLTADQCLLFFLLLCSASPCFYIQEHQQEADNQKSARYPYHMDSVIGRKIAADSGSYRKQNYDSQIIHCLAQLLWSSFSQIKRQCCRSASQITDTHRTRI